MDSNILKMNASKTEYIYFGSSHQLAKCKNMGLDVNKNLVERTDVIKYLGAYIDEQLNMRKNITEICQKAMYELYRLRRVRKF